VRRVFLCLGCSRPVEGRQHCEACGRAAFDQMRHDLGAAMSEDELMRACRVHPLERRRREREEGL